MGRRASAVRLRVTARRPASWLALGAAATAAWCVTAPAAGWWPGAAIVAGAAVAAAALGTLPRDGMAAWAAWRVAWPMVGGLCGWLAGGADPATIALPGALLTTCALTATTVAAATRAGLAPADATGCGLAAGGAAAAAAVACLTVPSLGGVWPPLAVAGWAGVTAAVPWLRRVGVERSARPRGPLAGIVPRVAMVTALAAMVVFLFLATQAAWGYAVVAAGWLCAIAVPRAALGPGLDGAAARRLLVATTGWRGWPAASAARIVAAYAAVLMWPPLVAAVLAGAAGAARPLLIAGGVGTLAGTFAAVICGALAAGRSRDTALALALCAAVVAGAGLASRGLAPAIPGRGLMLSNPADPATLPESRTEPRLRQSPRGVASCPASPSPASCRPFASREPSRSC